MTCAPADFVSSWGRALALYDDLLTDPSRAWLAAMRALVVQLQNTYGDTLRAGTSMTTLVSRSRDHGLRADQRSVALKPHATYVEIVADRRWRLDYGSDLEPLTTVLDELAALPID